MSVCDTNAQAPYKQDVWGYDVPSAPQAEG